MFLLISVFTIGILVGIMSILIVAGTLAENQLYRLQHK